MYNFETLDLPRNVGRLTCLSCHFKTFMRCCGLIVSALYSGSREALFGLLGKTLYSHSASLHPGVQMGTGKFAAGDNPMMD